MSAELFYPGVRVPETVRIEGDSVKWELPRNSIPSYSDHRRSIVRPTDRSILDFSRLKDGNSICSYAAKRGILWAIQIRPEHQRETDLELTDGTVWRLGDPRSRVFAEVGETHLSGAEPIALWLSLARRLRAILRINAALKGRTRRPLPEVGTSEDWESLGAGPIPDDPREAQFFLQREVNWWLLIGGVRLGLGIAEFSRESTAWKLDIAYEGLAGGIAYRLLLMVIGESKLYACDGCGCPYIREAKAPRPGQENFCPDCTGIAQKRAVDRYRQGKRKNDKKTRAK